MVIDIRDARSDDFDNIFKLLLQLWPDKELNFSILRNIFLENLASSETSYLCIETDGNIIGFCSLAVRNSLWQEGRMGHINELIIDKSFRHTGLGTGLLKAAIAVAKKKGCKRIELDSAFHREDAHRFYEYLGFARRAYLFSATLVPE